MTGWSAFWMLCAVFVICECILTLRGVNTALWQYRTLTELEIQRQLPNHNPPPGYAKPPMPPAPPKAPQ